MSSFSIIPTSDQGKLYLANTADAAAVQTVLLFDAELEQVTQVEVHMPEAAAPPAWKNEQLTEAQEIHVAAQRQTRIDLHRYAVDPDGVAGFTMVGDEVPAWMRIEDSHVLVIDPAAREGDVQAQQGECRIRAADAHGQASERLWRVAVNRGARVVGVDACVSRVYVQSVPQQTVVYKIEIECDPKTDIAAHMFDDFRAWLQQEGSDSQAQLQLRPVALVGRNRMVVPLEVSTHDAALLALPPAAETSFQLRCAGKLVDAHGDSLDLGGVEAVPIQLTRVPENPRIQPGWSAEEAEPVFTPTSADAVDPFVIFARNVPCVVQVDRVEDADTGAVVADAEEAARLFEASATIGGLRRRGSDNADAWRSFADTVVARLGRNPWRTDAGLRVQVVVTISNAFGGRHEVGRPLRIVVAPRLRRLLPRNVLIAAAPTEPLPAGSALFNLLYVCEDLYGRSVQQVEQGPTEFRLSIGGTFTMTAPIEATVQRGAASDVLHLTDAAPLEVEFQAAQVEDERLVWKWDAAHIEGQLRTRAAIPTNWVRTSAAPPAQLPCSLETGRALEAVAVTFAHPLVANSVGHASCTVAWHPRLSLRVPALDPLYYSRSGTPSSWPVAVHIAEHSLTPVVLAGFEVEQPSADTLLIHRPMSASAFDDGKRELRLKVANPWGIERERTVFMTLTNSSSPQFAVRLLTSRVHAELPEGHTVAHVEGVGTTGEALDDEGDQWLLSLEEVEQQEGQHGAFSLRGSDICWAGDTTQGGPGRTLSCVVVMTETRTGARLTTPLDFEHVWVDRSPKFRAEPTFTDPNGIIYTGGKDTISTIALDAFHVDAFHPDGIRFGTNLTALDTLPDAIDDVCRFRITVVAENGVADERVVRVPFHHKAAVARDRVDLGQVVRGNAEPWTVDMCQAFDIQASERLQVVATSPLPYGVENTERNTLRIVPASLIDAHVTVALTIDSKPLVLAFDTVTREAKAFGSENQVTFIEDGELNDAGLVLYRRVGDRQGLRSVVPEAAVDFVGLASCERWGRFGTDTIVQRDASGAFFVGRPLSGAELRAAFEGAVTQGADSSQIELLVSAAPTSATALPALPRPVRMTKRLLPPLCREAGIDVTVTAPAATDDMVVETSVNFSVDLRTLAGGARDAIADVELTGPAAEYISVGELTQERLEMRMPAALFASTDQTLSVFASATSIWGQRHSTPVEIRLHLTNATSRWASPDSDRLVTTRTLRAFEEATHTLRIVDDQGIADVRVELDRVFVQGFDTSDDHALAFGWDSDAQAVVVRQGKFFFGLGGVAVRVVDGLGAETILSLLWDIARVSQPPLPPTPLPEEMVFTLGGHTRADLRATNEQNPADIPSHAIETVRYGDVALPDLPLDSKVHVENGLFRFPLTEADFEALAASLRSVAAALPHPVPLEVDIVARNSGNAVARYSWAFRVAFDPLPPRAPPSTLHLHWTRAEMLAGSREIAVDVAQHCGVRAHFDERLRCRVENASDLFAQPADAPRTITMDLGGSAMVRPGDLERIDLALNVEVAFYTEGSPSAPLRCKVPVRVTQKTALTEAASSKVIPIVLNDDASTSVDLEFEPRGQAAIATRRVDISGVASCTHAIEWSGQGQTWRLTLRDVVLSGDRSVGGAVTIVLDEEAPALVSLTHSGISTPRCRPVSRWIVRAPRPVVSLSDLIVEHAAAVRSVTPVSLCRVLEKLDDAGRPTMPDVELTVSPFDLREDSVGSLVAQFSVVTHWGETVGPFRIPLTVVAPIRWVREEGWDISWLAKHQPAEVLTQSIRELVENADTAAKTVESAALVSVEPLPDGFTLSESSAYLACTPALVAADWWAQGQLEISLAIRCRAVDGEVETAQGKWRVRFVSDISLARSVPGATVQFFDDGLHAARVTLSELIGEDNEITHAPSDVVSWSLGGATLDTTSNTYAVDEVAELDAPSLPSTLDLVISGRTSTLRFPAALALEPFRRPPPPALSYSFRAATILERGGDVPLPDAIWPCTRLDGVAAPQYAERPGSLAGESLSLDVQRNLYRVGEEPLRLSGAAVHTVYLARWDRSSSPHSSIVVPAHVELARQPPRAIQGEALHVAGRTRVATSSRAAAVSIPLTSFFSNLSTCDPVTARTVQCDAAGISTRCSETHVVLTADTEDVMFDGSTRVVLVELATVFGDVVRSEAVVSFGRMLILPEAVVCHDTVIVRERDGCLVPLPGEGRSAAGHTYTYSIARAGVAARPFSKYWAVQEGAVTLDLPAIFEPGLLFTDGLRLATSAEPLAVRIEVSNGELEGEVLLSWTDVRTAPSASQPCQFKLYHLPHQSASGSGALIPIVGLFDEPTAAFTFEPRLNDVLRYTDADVLLFEFKVDRSAFGSGVSLRPEHISRLAADDKHTLFRTGLREYTVACALTRETIGTWAMVEGSPHSASLHVPLFHLPLDDSNLVAAFVSGMRKVVVSTMAGDGAVKQRMEVSLVEGLVRCEPQTAAESLFSVAHRDEEQDEGHVVRHTTVTPQTRDLLGMFVFVEEGQSFPEMTTPVAPTTQTLRQATTTTAQPPPARYYRRRR